ncbi:hypothetical protein B0H17DRAFT_1111031 [Mycena rosella]|uniref:Uncharacterized protein n=1 Tax=Mycena rosella TaxID=1033263 RepID=A0AAD7BMD1_MYCRO|nr:hypothetical protein B0H17DRAFT_1111031 [Mycena rosella]
MNAPPVPQDISFDTYFHAQAATYLQQNIASAQQWRDVALRLPIESFSALAAHHGPFPLLRSLSLSTSSRVSNERQMIKIRDAPLLREVTLADFPIATADLPWEQLTTLKITTHEMEPAIAALQRCSGLVDLEFSLIVSGKVSLDIPLITLASLKSVKTTGESILPFITVPSLEKLGIWGPGFLGDMASVTESLEDLLQRSSCPLQSLSFRVPPKITTAAFGAFLQAAAPIAELELTFQFPNGLDELVAVLQSTTALPWLATLRIVDAAGGDTFAPLLDTLRARRASLQSFALTLYSELPAPARVPPTAVMAEFTALADAGLRVRVVNAAGVLLDM